MAFQRRNWFAERCGWLVMAAILVAAALGVFAVGPLSSTTAAGPNATLRVEYGRMQRFNAPFTIKLTVSASAVSTAGVVIDIHNAFTEALRLTTVRPEPAQTTALADRMRLQFVAAAGEDATIRLYVSAEKIGLARLRLGLQGGEFLELPMFIYP